MGITVAYLAECQGSASIDEQRACLAPDDHVLVAGKHSFNKLEDLLTQHGMTLTPGDRIKVYDLSCITLSTNTLIRLLANMLRNGVTFEIVSLGLVIEPSSDDKLHILVDAFEAHYRHVHGVKTHPADSLGRGRRRIIEPERLDEIRTRLDAGTTTTALAQDLGVSRSTLFNFLERYDRDWRISRTKKAGRRDAEGCGEDADVEEAEAGEGSC